MSLMEYPSVRIRCDDQRSREACYAVYQISLERWIGPLWFVKTPAGWDRDGERHICPSCLEHEERVKTNALNQGGSP